MKFKLPLLALLALTAAAPAAPVVTTPQGKLSGLTVDGVRVFKGIPYAQAPVGDLRWKPPVPAKPWTGTRDATMSGPACMQPVGRPKTVYTDDPATMSEDCLSLNVFAPAGARKMPVMLWIHGGALVGGHNGSAMYDGTNLAQKGVIVVSINYRLGIFGYLTHPGLSAESAHGVSGNYGILDQIEALKWVKANIASFGGDPSNVTIAGESAGALSVMDLMASPLARGLFNKAIAQSAYMVANPELKKSVYGLPSGEQLGQIVSAALKAPDVAALRAIPATALNEAASKGYQPWPTVDGYVLPRQLVETFDAGEQARVPLLTGYNSGEIRSLRRLAPLPPADAATYEKTIRANYGDLSDAFLKLYPADNLEESILAASRDGIYGWTSQRLARNQAAIGARGYVYLWDHGYPAAEALKLHAFHASELTYSWGHVGAALPADWPMPAGTPAERALADALVGYWTSFVKTGVPSAPGQPVWAAYGETAAYMAFRGKPIASTDLMPGAYALQEQIVCRRRADGKQAWLMNIGLAAGTLPPATAACSKVK